MGGYRLLARLGAGGMGVVYLGRTPGGRFVAVKLVHEHFGADARYRARFRREVAAAARLLLIGGAVVLAAAGCGAAAPLTGADSRATDEAKNPGKSPNATPAASPSSNSPSPSPKPIKLELVITGDAPLSAFTYWVNGHPTTLNSVPLT
ncbi:protein kinase family protein [Streptomyces gossypiisoli]|uniref:hypothetical protein n=1 Tax=Streptomyces gossypiisoli TaxID=2748864 RepID=UPI0018D9DA26